MNISIHKEYLKNSEPKLLNRLQNACYRKLLQLCQKLKHRLALQLYGSNPLTTRPLASKDYYNKLHQEEVAKKYQEITAFEE